MVIDAIFIQSWHGELINKSLRCLLHQLHDTIDNAVPVWAFVDETSLDIPDALKEMKQLQRQGLTRFEFVDDTEYKNPQTTVFYHLLHAKTSLYPRVLLLEADCRLSDKFDVPINQDIANFDTEWWIYGSTYYGIGGGEIEDDANHIRRNHMNGVAVYNRTPGYMRYTRLLFETERGRDREEAFDWLFAIRYFESTHKNRELLYDSPYIINLSPVWDCELNASTRKPLATIVHQKSV